MMVMNPADHVFRHKQFNVRNWV